MVVSEERMAALEARTARLEAHVGLFDAWDDRRETAPRGDESRVTARVVEPRVVTSVDESYVVTPADESRVTARVVEPRVVTSVDESYVATPADEPHIVAPVEDRRFATSVEEPHFVAPADEPISARPVREPVAVAPRLEELLGGRVLGWVGGVAVLVGVLFFLVVAASRGWIGQEARVLMAASASLLLLATGSWLHERRGRTEAALAAAATGIAGLFAAAVVAGPVYSLVPALVALAAALAIGASATALALRWEAAGMGWLGILGALVSPALVGAAGDGAGIALMLVAYSAAGTVMLWQRWHALAGAAFLVAVPQLAWWLVDWYVDSGPSDAAAIAVLAGFGAVTAVGAIGFEWRTGTSELRVSAHVLLALNALALAGLGAFALGDGGTHAWLAALAVAHLAAGVLARRSRRVSRELPLALGGLGIVLADVAFAALADGLPLVLGWAAGAVGFSALARLARHRSDATVALAGLGGHLLLAAATALTGTVPLSAVGGDAPDQAAALAALVALATGAWAAARLVAPRRPELRIVLDAAALSALALLSAVALDGAALTAALAAEAVALATVARRARAAVGRVASAGRADGSLAAVGADPLPFPAALAFLGTALAHALTTLAPPEALARGLEHPLPAALGLGAVVVASVRIARAGRSAQERTGLVAGAAVVGLYLASVLLVTPFQAGDPAAAGLPLSELDARQQGQVLLSVLWALGGVGALVAGLLRDVRVLRLGALALLGVTAGKVFLVDLASLTSLYRVGSCIALGLLLLIGAFAWQRIRPRALTALREVPGALR